MTEQEWRKQELRNALAEIEDNARSMRNRAKDYDTCYLANQMAQLVQIIRQEIVK